MNFPRVGYVRRVRRLRLAHPAVVAACVLAGTASAAAPACTTSARSGACGAYTYAGITNSNGYNTYTDQDMWAAKPGTTQTLRSTSPGRWQVVVDARPAGSTGVQTYPNVQQLFNDWTGAGWNGNGPSTDTPLSGLASLRSSYTESMPHDSRTIAEGAYDIWLSHVPKRDPDEVMIWVDNVNRGAGGAARIGSATVGGKRFAVLQYGGAGGELIFSLSRNERSGTIDILGALTWLVRHRYEPATLAIGQIDFGWEICSETTPAPGNTFAVSRYGITAVPRNRR